LNLGYIQGSHPSKPAISKTFLRPFKTELPRNQDPIDKIWKNLEKSGRGKANQRIWNDVPTAPE
jgi:hypothetical protein